MGMFKNTLLLAQQGNEKAMEKLLNRYDPLLKKCSIIQGCIRIQNLTKKVAVAIQCGGHFLF